jgi:hypothetical protein
MIQGICEDKLLALKSRYSQIHPLMFQRSVERAKNLADLFEILERIPVRFPVVWDDSKRMWVKETDPLSQKNLKELASKKKRK